MYKENLKKQTSKRLRTVGFRVSPRKIQKVEVTEVRQSYNIYNIPVIIYKVTLKDNNKIKYKWMPSDFRSYDCKCVLFN